MLLPLAIAISSVAVGALVGLIGRRKSASSLSARTLSTFALVAALAVVLAQLLPDALGAVGLPALGLFALAAALPTVLEKAAEKLGQGTSRRWGLELGYIGLCLHKVADGIGLGLYGGSLHAGHDHFDVLFAIAAHTVPVVALVTIAFHRDSGLNKTLLRIAVLALATVIGVGSTELIPTEAFAAAEPWLTAGVAGLLLHVVAHDWHPEERPTQLAGRLVDLLAVAAGLLLVLMAGGHGDHHGHDRGDGVRADMAAALLDLSLETAPALLFGLAIGAVLTALGSRLPTRWLRSGGAFRQALRGAIVGAPLPICACGVLPLAASLRRRGAGAALVVAFLVSTPELGVETFALTARFVGYPFAFVRLGAAILLAMIAALVVHRVARGQQSESFDGPVVPDEEPSDVPFGKRLIASFDELLYHVAPWTVVGLVAAAYVQAVLPTGALGGLREYGLDVLIVAIVAVPSYVCAASATPLAAVLLLKGMSPGAVLVGLLLGPATNLATVGFLRKSYGGRATAFGIGSLVLAAGGLAAIVNYVGLPFEVSSAAVAEHSHGWFAIGTALLLGAALLRSIWRAGLRPWLASLGESLSISPEAGHAHAHGYAHSHSHHHHHDEHHHHHHH